MIHISFYLLGHFALANTVNGIEGDVAILRSPYVDILEDQCVNFDLYLLFSPDSTENSFRVTLTSADLPFAHPFTLHEILGWRQDNWIQVSLPLIPGLFRVGFELTMGFAFQSSAALDNVEIGACIQKPTVKFQTDQSWYKSREDFHGLGQDLGPWFKIKIAFYQHRKSHCGDETTVSRLISTMGFSMLVSGYFYI